jgi:biotin synthase
MDLLYEGATIHKEYQDPNLVQVSTLLSIKTGDCPEDSVYCPLTRIIFVCDMF